jgi:oligopeptide transport system permease protein
LIVIACVFGPLFLPEDSETSQNLALRYQPPSLSHPAGTDSLGRDMISRLLHGGQVSLLVGCVATVVSIFLGTIIGATAGFAGGRTDSLLMRAVDLLYGFPLILLVILLTSVFGDEVRGVFLSLFPSGTVLGNMADLALLFGAIGAVEWLTMARIVRGQVLSLKHQEFVESARLLGQGGSRILVRHLIPNVTGPIIAYGTLTVPAVMLLEATLSFLGLGVQPPKSSWGVLIKEGAEAMGDFPWLLWGPAICFSLTLLCLNAFGDSLRDALDPRGSDAR